MTTMLRDTITGQAGAAGQLRIPRQGAAAGVLLITGGASGLVLRPGSAPDPLLAAAFSGEQPQVTTRDGQVCIAYPRHDLIGWLRDSLRSAGRRRGELALSPDVPWRLRLSGGAAGCSLSLRGLLLQELTIAGGASDLRLELPAAGGVIPVRIEGGASNLTLLSPRGGAVRLRIGGGVTNLRFDQQRVGSQGGEGVWVSDPAGLVAGGYDVTITGGATGITVMRD